MTETPSQELATSISLAEKKGIVFVASAGNDGQMEMVYPAGLTSVMGVASTNPQDQRSSFSNYGDQIVWVAAQGEAIVTTYPFGGYAAGWGTSFSAPMVSGAVDLLQSGQRGLTVTQARVAMAQANCCLHSAWAMAESSSIARRALSATNMTPLLELCRETGPTPSISTPQLRKIGAARPRARRANARPAQRGSLLLQSAPGSARPEHRRS